jgi:hypothetical protein
MYAIEVLGDLNEEDLNHCINFGLEYKAGKSNK